MSSASAGPGLIRRLRTIILTDFVRHQNRPTVFGLALLPGKTSSDPKKYPWPFAQNRYRLGLTALLAAPVLCLFYSTVKGADWAIS